MMDAYSVYSWLPPCLQTVACSLAGVGFRHRRYGGDFEHLLGEMERRSRWSQDETVHYRDGRMLDFLGNVVARSPFYQRRFKELGVDPSELQDLDDLRRLPVLCKDEAQVHCLEMAPASAQFLRSNLVHTSGTTGGGLRFSQTLSAEREQWAVWWRYRQWHGIDPHTWCGYFGGRTIVPPDQLDVPYWRVNWPGRQVLFSAYHINPKSLPTYVCELRRRRLPWLHGYPSLLALLASHMLDSGSDLGYQPRCITTGAENLLPQQRLLIERAFGTKPRQHYGLTEAVANFSECERGVLHVDEDFASTEFLLGADGTAYRVIGSNFTNSAFPLIRYDSGDVASLRGGSCDCGKPGRLVAAVDGRREDYVVLNDGSRVGRMDHIFKDLARIREAQIYQRRQGQLVYYVVKGVGYSERDEAHLIHETRLRLGARASVQIEYVDRVQRTNAGKLRFVVSELKEAKLESIGD